MADLEVRQFRYFVAVAEELHFGRAAERLGMAQPPLSRAIRKLERQLGVPLFERTTRQVTLTPAGESFLRDARATLDAVAAAARRARHAGQPAPRLRLALKADYDAGLLPQILAAYQAEAAALPVAPVLGRRGEQAPALRDGRADVALLPTPCDLSGLDAEPLVSEPRVVALAADDPLAARTCLRLADLAGKTRPDGTPADRDALPRPLTEAGRSAPDLSEIFKLIDLGGIVAFLPASVAERNPRPDIAYRPVTDLEPVTLAVAWPQVSHSPSVAAFVRAATTVAATTVAAATVAATVGPEDADLAERPRLVERNGHVVIRRQDGPAAPNPRGSVPPVSEPQPPAGPTAGLPSSGNRVDRRR